MRPIQPWTRLASLAPTQAFLSKVVPRGALGLALALAVAALLGPGCGGSSRAEAAASGCHLVDMEFVPAAPIVAPVGDVLLVGTLDGALLVHPDTGVMNGQVQAVFSDGSTVAVSITDSVATMTVGAMSVVIGNGDDDVILIDGAPESARNQARLFFQGLQQQPQPGQLPPQSQAFAPYWLMRYAWAWAANSLLVRQRGQAGLPELPGTRLFRKLDCHVTVPAIAKLLGDGACASLEARCRLGATIDVGGVPVPCNWLLAVCVNGQYVGDDNAYALWESIR